MRVSADKMISKITLIVMIVVIVRNEMKMSQTMSLTLVTHSVCTCQNLHID